MPVTGLDHVGLPTADAERLLAFYKALGFGVAGEAEWRAGDALIFSIVCGDNKINVHPEGMIPFRGQSWYQMGATSEPGSGDMCFVWEGGIDSLLTRMSELGREPLLGPAARTGGRANGSAKGIGAHFRDPDGNLVEFISYLQSDLEQYHDGEASRRARAFHDAALRETPS